MVDVQGIYPASRAYAREHGQQCAKEIMEWRETGIYQGHLLAELANILKPLDSARSMQMAEDLVIEVALAKLAASLDPNAEDKQHSCNREFAVQIASALMQLGTDAALGCMGRVMCWVAADLGQPLQFTCDLGVVTIEPKQPSLQS